MCIHGAGSWQRVAATIEYSTASACATSRTASVVKLLPAQQIGTIEVLPETIIYLDPNSKSNLVLQIQLAVRIKINDGFRQDLYRPYLLGWQ